MTAVLHASSVDDATYADLEYVGNRITARTRSGASFTMEALPSTPLRLPRRRIVSPDRGGRAASALVEALKGEVSTF